MKRNRMLVFLAVLLAATLACGLFSSRSGSPDETVHSGEGSQSDGSVVTVPVHMIPNSHCLPMSIILWISATVRSIIRPQWD
jgi:hypothetical protein